MEHGVERAGDQIRAVVEDLEIHTLRERGADLLELLLGRGHHPAAVLPANHHHHPRHDFPTTPPGRSPLTDQRGDRRGADVADQDRHAACRTADDHPLDVVDATEQRLAADEPLLAVLDDVAATGARVVAIERLQHLAQRDAVRRHPVGVHLHLVALGIAAVAVDIGDARNGPHHGGDVPLQDAAEVHQASPWPLDLKLQNLTERRAQRSQLGVGLGQRDPGPGRRQPLGDELTGSKDIGSLPEHDRDGGDAEPRHAPDLLDARQPAHRELDGVGDQPLDLQRRQRARLGDDLDLHVDEIGHGVDGNLRGGVEAAQGHEYEQRDHQRTIRQRPRNHA